MKSEETIITFGDIMAKARINAGKSQQYMAKAIGKSLSTIKNWEIGYGVPSIADVSKWYDILHVNAINAFLEYFHPDTYSDSTLTDPAKTKETLLHYIYEVASADEINKLSFCIFGNTGSSCHSQLEMLVAHNHTDLRSRVNVSQTICDNYEMDLARGKTVCNDSVLPNMENLKLATQKGREAVYSGNSGYSTMNHMVKEQNEKLNNIDDNEEKTG